MADKDGNIGPLRSTSVDGFLGGAGQQPRRPYMPPAQPPRPLAPAPRPAQDFSLPQPAKAPSPQPVAFPQPMSEKEVRNKAVLQDGGDTYPLKPVEGRARQRGRAKDKADANVYRKASSRRTIFKRILKLLGILLLLGVLAGGYFFYKNIAKLTGNANPFSLISVFTPAHLDNENGRVNVLVAGNSADDQGHGGADLTDSIMILSLDTRTNKALMLSIPRDLWVKLPGRGHAKINSAYPSGGMDELKQVIEDNMDIPIHYTVLVNYTAFRDLVDGVGGITINIQSKDPRGIYDPNIDYTTRRCCALAKYPNGPVTLNGKQALNLARARGDPNPYGIPYGFEQGDFTRTENQRKMLLAIKAKASSTGVVANPLKVTSLVDAVGNNVKTDLKINEIQSLYFYMKKVNDADIDSYNINTLKGGNTTMLQNYTTPDGQSALIPAAGIDDFSDISTQIKKVFTASPLSKEAANVVILNGTDAIGLARLQANKLSAAGITIASVGDAEIKQPNTTIIDNSQGQKPKTLAELKKRFNATVVTNTRLTYTYPDADFIVILGNNVVQQVNAAAQNSKTN